LTRGQYPCCCPPGHPITYAIPQSQNPDAIPEEHCPPSPLPPAAGTVRLRASWSGAPASRSQRAYAGPRVIEIGYLPSAGPVPPTADATSRAVLCASAPRTFFSAAKVSTGKSACSQSQRDGPTNKHLPPPQLISEMKRPSPQRKSEERK
jgi:hypothetical protein